MSSSCWENVSRTCRYFWTMHWSISRYFLAFALLNRHTMYMRIWIWYGSRIEKVSRVFQVKNRVKTWQVRWIRSQKFEHKHVPKHETEPGVRKNKCSLLACYTRCKCFVETTHTCLKVKFGIKVKKWWKVWLNGKSLGQRVWVSYCWIRSPYRP